jgi:hypothetical protein
MKNECGESLVKNKKFERTRKKLRLLIGKIFPLFKQWHWWIDFTMIGFEEYWDYWLYISCFHSGIGKRWIVEKLMFISYSFSALFISAFSDAFSWFYSLSVDYGFEHGNIRKWLSRWRKENAFYRMFCRWSGWTILFSLFKLNIETTQFTGH